MGRAALLLTAIVAVFGPADARADVADYLGKPIVSMQVVVEGRPTTDSRLLALIETTPGRTLSMLAVRESITHLFTLGRFEDVRVSADTVTGGVNLTYELVPVHPIDRIEFSGPTAQPGIDVKRLRRAVVDRSGPSPSASRRFDLARIVEDDLRVRGYLHATVQARIAVFHDPDRATLTFELNPGVRTIVGAVEVQGDSGVTADRLLDELQLRKGMPFERDALTTRIEQFLQQQWNDGFVDAKLSPSIRLTDDDRVASVMLTAARGSRVRVVFKGDPIPRDQHERLVPVAAEASADEDLLEDSTVRIEEYLKSSGYRDAVAPHTRAEVNGELLITFTVVRGPLYRVADRVISGNRFETLADVEPRLALRAGQAFSSARLDGDVAAIEDFYRRRGFAAVRIDTAVEPATEPSPSEVPLIVRLEITEGARTVVNSVHLVGNDSVTPDSLLPGLGLQAGHPFFLTQMAIDRDALQLQYANLGYQSATIAGNPGMSADGAQADVVFTITEGPRLVVDHVLIVGNERTKTETIEREIQVKAGDPLGLAAISESQRRLAELGLFRRVRITQVPHGDEDRRDLVVSVEEAPVTTIGYGGGLEVREISSANGTPGEEQLEFAPRAFFEVGRRNLFGKNRSINLFTRVSLHPESDQPTEYRVFGAFREPRLFNTTADAFLTGTVEQQRRSGFNFSRQGFSAELGRRLNPITSVSGNYQIQRTDLFDETFVEEDQLLIDRLFPQIVLSSFSGAVIRTTRNEPVSPSNGSYLTANGQVAARVIGSEVGFLKSYTTAQVFKTIPRSRETVFAGSARLGMSYGFPRTVTQTDADGNPILGPDGQPVSETVQDLPASERFFAGGDTTVRGFALDQLGTPETLDANGLALGGNAVVIFNAELRVPVRWGLGAVGFVDVGNVFKRTNDIDLFRLRTAVGFGLRYRSPIGPIRVDLGFKTHRNEIAPGRLESASSWHISLGQAF